jgi:hypothetical protein
MFLPLGCLKFYVSFVAAITLIIGILAIVGTSITLVKSKNDLSNINSNTSGVIGVALAPGILLTLAGLMGIIGGCKKVGAAICIFDICQIILFLFFVVLGAVGVALVVSTKDSLNDQTQCMKTFDNSNSL